MIVLFKFINLIFIFIPSLLDYIAAEITSNIDGSICLGEEVVYTCVSQGTSQRWRLDNDGVVVEHAYIRGQEPAGHVVTRNPYTFTLVSTGQNHFKSTVSVVATMSIHNTVVECTGITSRDSITIRIAGTPTSPKNLQNVVNEYHHHFSTVFFSWDAPDDQSRVDYYEYQVVHETSIFVYNTSNTTATVSGLVYNKNVTFLVFSHNCIGKSSPLNQTIYVVGCREFDHFSFNISESTFSQAPGTQILLSCYFYMDGYVITICQEDGRWEPDPDSLRCTIDPSTTRSNYYITHHYVPETPISAIETSPPAQNIRSYLIPLYVLASIGLCLSVGIAATCILLKLSLIQKRQKERTLAREVNQDHYEIIDPIYETINNDSTQNNFGMQVTMISNDAYENIRSLETKCNSCASLGIEASVNEAYTLNEMLIQKNNSYEAAQHLNNSPFKTDSEDPTDKHQCYEKQSMENIQPTEVLFTNQNSSVN